MAGYLEGYLTYKEISNHFDNYIAFNGYNKSAILPN